MRPEGRAPFEICVAPETLRDLRRRLQATRWPRPVDSLGWSAGTDHRYLRELVDYWLNDFEWRKQEATLNAFAHFRTSIDGLGIHYVHERGRGPNPLPLILTHGYPDSFFRFVKLIPLLTDPAAHGGRAEDAFDVVVPDLPGYGFSDPPQRLGTTFRIHDLWARLMTKVLGYRRFVAHGSDWGGTVTEQLARSHAGAVAAIHLTDILFWHLFRQPRDPSAAEKAFLQRNEKWMQVEGGYASIQSTKPQSLAPGLNDSPVGLAAWLVEKYRAWSDCAGRIESAFTKDELLTQIMIYWATETIGSSFLTYFDYANAGPLTWTKEALKQWAGAAKVPAAFALFPQDISRPPREWAERFFNVQRWTKMPRGGHFAALEEPELLAQDLREFFRAYRKA